MIDLHTHSTASDGTRAPEELVRFAKEAGLKALALTDHDTIGGLDAFLKAGEALELNVIPGVEISVDHCGQEMHILGYYIDHTNPSLNAGLEDLQAFRNERNPRIIKLLQEAGLDITIEEIKAKAGGKVLGRPHFAAVMVEKGFVNSIQEAFDVYLAKGGKAFVPKEKLLPAEGIALIRKAGGLPVLAHPKYLKEKGEALRLLLADLKIMGLAGLEVYYTTHSREERQEYLDFASQLGLLVTGGTDYHGENKPQIQLGLGEGDLAVPDDLVAKLLSWKEAAG